MELNAGIRRWWTKEEDCVLRREAELQLNQGALKNWSAIAGKLPGRSNKDCRKRWSKVSEPVKKGAWSGAEDDRLRKAVDRHGLRWILVAQDVGTRHADQCAKRWRHSLDPNIDHREWTQEEDTLLVNAVRQFGNNWRTICNKEFPDRSTTDLKNRHILVSRKERRTLAFSSPSPAHQEPDPHQELFDKDEDKDEDEGDDEDEDDEKGQDDIEFLDCEAILSNPSITYSGDPAPLTCTPHESTAYSPDSNVLESSLLDAQSQYQQPQHDSTFSFLNADTAFPVPPDGILSPSTVPLDDYFWSNDNLSVPTPTSLSTPNSNSSLPQFSGTQSSNATPFLPSTNANHQVPSSATSHIRSASAGGNRTTMILEDVRPDMVGIVLTTLFQYGATFRMRLENTED